MNDLNNYCHNCGAKIEKDLTKCPNCNTEILTKRIRTDNRYIIYLLIHFSLIIAGIITSSIWQFIFYILAYITICGCANKYPQRFIVGFILGVESAIVIAYVSLLLIFFTSCFLLGLF